MFQAAVVAAEEEAPDDDAKAKVVAKDRLLGNMIIASSLVFLIGGAVLFYAWRVQG
jgi:hypothetical protein